MRAAHRCAWRRLLGGGVEFESDVPVSSLPPFSRQSVEATINADDRAAAFSIVERLQGVAD